MSEMMGQRAAALLVPDQHDLDAVACQHVDGGAVDARRQHLLGAALQQRDPSATFADGRKTLPPAGPGGGRRPRKRQHRLDPFNKVGVTDPAAEVGE